MGAAKLEEMATMKHGKHEVPEGMKGKMKDEKPPKGKKGRKKGGKRDK